MGVTRDLRPLARSREVEALLGVSRWTLAKMVRERRIPGVVVLGRSTLRYDLDQIEAWMRAGGERQS